MHIFEEWISQADQRPAKRPWVSLCYAQSLDGCVTLQRGRPLVLSGAETRRLTHWLRSKHDAIVVGSGTVLADNPQLTVRLVEGQSPQPIILDSRLRTPPNARLISGHPRPAWIATAEPTDPVHRAALEAAGATLLFLPPDKNGGVALTSLLDCLAQRGVSRLMVEGGAQVITSFLASGLVDVLCVTIAPVLLGGLHAVEQALPHPLRLREVYVETLGGDVVVWGKLD
mgnify:CR=1 FL=1